MAWLSFNVARRLVVVAAVAFAPNFAVGQDHSKIYAPEALQADAKRLQTVIRKLEGVADMFLTAEEREALKRLEVEFPMPVEGDNAINFYAFSDFGESVAVMPIMSLKMLEDVTTAYAYLLTEGYSPDTVDLYFAAIAREDPSAFPGGRYPPLLPTLGVPDDAWKMPQVDALSLRLRNEAFAFAFFHELGHIRFKHKGDVDLTVAESVAAEVEADQFAIDLMARADSGAVGATLLFFAQGYSLPNRGRFPSDDAWLTFLKEKKRHPVTSDRIRAFGEHMETVLAGRRPAERALWAGIGSLTQTMAAILADDELQSCIVDAASRLNVDALAPRRSVRFQEMVEICS